MKNKKPKEKRVKPQKVKKEKNEKTKKEREPWSIQTKLSLFGLSCIALYLAIAIPMLFVFAGFSMLWFWFGFFAVVALVAPIGLFVGFLPRDPNKKQFTAAVKRSILLTLFVWFFDLLYMAVFNRWIVWEYIFGLIAIVLLFSNLTRSFLSDKKGGKWILPFEFLADVGLSIYLIYRIPNDDLRTIVTTVAAALFGGFLTLVGVAWTIRNQKKSQDEDNRIHATPYLTIDNGDIQSKTFTAYFPVPDQSLTGWLISIREFRIKNVSENLVIVKELYFGNELAVFDSETVLEKDSIVKFGFIENYDPFTSKISNYAYVSTLPDYVRMRCSDIYGNIYEYKLFYQQFEFQGFVPSKNQLLSDAIIITSISSPIYIGKEGTI